MEIVHCPSLPFTNNSECFKLHYFNFFNLILTEIPRIDADVAHLIYIKAVQEKKNSWKFFTSLFLPHGTYGMHANVIWYRWGCMSIQPSQLDQACVYCWLCNLKNKDVFWFCLLSSCLNMNELINLSK